MHHSGDRRLYKSSHKARARSLIGLSITKHFDFGQSRRSFGMFLVQRVDVIGAGQSTPLTINPLPFHYQMAEGELRFVDQIIGFKIIFPVTADAHSNDKARLSEFQQCRRLILRSFGCNSPRNHGSIFTIINAPNPTPSARIHLIRS